jgi:hypothetical protein
VTKRLLEDLNVMKITRSSACILSLVLSRTTSHPMPVQSLHQSHPVGFMPQARQQHISRVLIVVSIAQRIQLKLIGIVRSSSSFNFILEVKIFVQIDKRLSLSYSSGVNTFFRVLLEGTAILGRR